ncbi:MAG: Dabb family protein [Bacteroidia bacterium]|nr:Dabb family protein [Bacteroidia bacterium]
MIRHIVLFKIKNFSSESERNEALENVLVTFRSLIGQIPQIRQYRVEPDCVHEPSSFDVIIDSAFDTLNDLKSYQAHPAHIDAVALNKQWSVGKIVCDYFFENHT